MEKQYQPQRLTDMKVRNFLTGIVVAILLALPFVKPTVGRIETWKIVLGISGLILFVRAGTRKPDHDA